MPAEPGTGVVVRTQNALEQWIYRLNEADHWIFRLYDWGNEVWAALAFRGTRRRASALDVTVEAGERRARVRFLTAADVDTFATLLAGFDVKYLPPHGLDRQAAGAALRRRSYVPIGIFVDDCLVGYILLRLFFPRRAVTGIWMLASTHNAKLGRRTLQEAVDFLRREDLANYCTIPLDNTPSIKIAHACGWRIVRTNQRFHVLYQR